MDFRILSFALLFDSFAARFLSFLCRETKDVPEFENRKSPIPYLGSPFSCMASYARS